LKPPNIEAHNELQRDYFAERVKHTMVPAETAYIARHVDKMIKGAGLQTGQSIIDIGCGMGKFTLPILKRGFKVTGLDLSPFLLEHFQRLAPEGTKTVCADVLDAPQLLGPQFDRVIGFFVLHHFPELDRHFKALAGLLKPGGTIAFIEPNAWNPLYYLQITFSPGMSWSAEKGVLNMRRRAFEQAAAAAGLQLKAMEQYGFFPPFVYNTKPGKRCDSMAEMLFSFTGMLPFQLITLHRPGD
jgi:2-polyprenyl-3-methyl-5-hydroxy-6-metoxy-1,4-benzoquinol methylase